MDIADDFLGDHNCEHCGVMNSYYPDDRCKRCIETIGMKPEAYCKLCLKNKEDNMSLNYQDEKYQGKFIYMPKIGETLEIKIKELREVKSDNPKFNFSENVPVMINGEPAIDDEGEAITKKKDLGYHVEAELENGKILSVTSIAAFIQVFKKHQLNDGDEVKIFHKDKSEWIVEKLNG
jgi:hypothetical protein